MKLKELLQLSMYLEIRMRCHNIQEGELHAFMDEATKSGFPLLADEMKKLFDYFASKAKV